jgi:hypothetical protein
VVSRDFWHTTQRQVMTPLPPDNHLLKNCLLYSDSHHSYIMQREEKNVLCFMLYGLPNAVLHSVNQMTPLFNTAASQIHHFQ